MPIKLSDPGTLGTTLPQKHLDFIRSISDLASKLQIPATGNVHVMTEAHSCNYCCNGKAISITYSTCASEALSIQH
jgi:hypothetical protein